jgi:hypothetical protein
MLLTGVAVGQQPEVRLKLDASVLELGEAVNIRIVCTNTGTPGAPEAVVPDGLNLELVHSNPYSSSVPVVCEGGRTDRVTYTYSMRVIAEKVGTFMLGPFSVVANGKTYRTEGVAITVRDAQPAAIPRGDRYIFAELDAAPTSLYATETYAATLTFGIRKVVIGDRTYELDMLESVVNLRDSVLSVFADERARKSERVFTDADGQRHGYEVFTVTKTFRANEAGPIRIGPVFLKANYPTEIRGGGAFGRERITRTRKETARAEAIVVDVKSPPDEGQPDDFRGSIGRYSMAIDAQPLQVERGQPVTLTISIRGSPLDGVAGPDLAQQPELASRFDFTKDDLVGDVEGAAKVFRRAIFPKRVGAQTIRPISWSYFDPESEEYVTLTSDPIELVVAPAGAMPTTVAELGQTEQSARGNARTVSGGGIAPNYTDPEPALVDQTFSLTLPWIITLAICPVSWLIVTLTNTHRRRLQRDVCLARRRRARRSAHARIKAAIRRSDPSEQLHEVVTALTRYVSDRFNLPSRTPTSDEVRTALARGHVRESTASEIVEFLRMCDTVRYATGTDGAPSAGAAAAKARRWIVVLEKDLD